MTKIYVVGVGMTPFGRHADKSVKDLTRAAVADALADAGATMSDVQSAFFANTSQGALEGQFMVGGQIALRAMGFESIPITNVENACASGSTAFHLACAYLKAGMAEVTLAVGVDKLFHPDKSKVATVFDGAWDVHDVPNIVHTLMELGTGVEAPPDRLEPAGPRSVFMDVYAALAKSHMRRYGTTERQLAAVSAKNHRHSVFNARSQYQMDMSIDDVLAARMISWPFTLPMCSPISDGAAAAILCTESALARFGSNRAIEVLSSVLCSGSDRSADEPEQHLCRTAALRAYEQAGLGPRDIGVAEVHDASAFAELVQTENLGFCEIGQGGWLAERGMTSLGGRIPVNPSGGLESKGHPIGATGLGQIFELVGQLRGEAGRRQAAGARIALAENGGGFHGIEEAAATITILAR
ncbi:thiolase family protein [Phenylobacterium sp.]|uniref:thiolase family protein n=1 Tax=Phenylobacterium sp. TaxID=1871053 RepID=UPI0035B4AA97